VAAVLTALLLAGCADDPEPPPPATLGPPCDADNGGLVLPPGFCAGVVADHLGSVRHLVAAGRDRLYLSVRHRQLELGGLLALGDADGDGRFEQVVPFGDAPGLGLAVHGETLYFAGDDTLYRFRLPPPGAGIAPLAPPEAWVTDIGMPGRERGANGLALEAGGGAVQLAVGTVSNACQPPDQERAPGVPGEHPCTRREHEAGIWRIPAGVAAGPLALVGERLVSGWRFGVAMGWDPHGGRMLTAGHGRDQLHDLWPALYGPEEDARLPLEELRAVTAGADFGWPYCLLTPEGQRRAPEYAAVAELEGYCEALPPALAHFPAHSSPNALVAGGGADWPAHYRDGVFVVLYGAYAEALAAVGRRVVYLPRTPTGGFGEPEDFATLAPEPEAQGGGLGRYRLSGLARGADGGLYLADATQGRIWRIHWLGMDEPPAPAP
jgi:glucose/arabinose dehydrogenase